MTNDQIYHQILDPWWKAARGITAPEIEIVTRADAQKHIDFIVAVSLHSILPTVGYPWKSYNTEKTPFLHWLIPSGIDENGETILAVGTTWHSVPWPSKAAQIIANLMVDGDVEKLEAFLEVLQVASAYKEFGWPHPSFRQIVKTWRRIPRILAHLQ